MQNLLRIFHSLIGRFQDESFHITILSSTETSVEPCIILRGIFTQEEMRSLYSSRLWDIATQIENDQMVITLTAKVEEKKKVEPELFAGAIDIVVKEEYV